MTASTKRDVLRSRARNLPAGDLPRRPGARHLDHKIHDLSYTGHWLACDCGWSVTEPGISPDELNDRYQDHRASVGLPRRGMAGSRGSEESPWRRFDGGERVA